ncbi:hypothetical protein ACHAXT_011496 [Thalassiosira profunda]
MPPATGKCCDGGGGSCRAAAPEGGGAAVSSPAGGGGDCRARTSTGGEVSEGTIAITARSSCCGDDNCRSSAETTPKSIAKPCCDGGEVTGDCCNSSAISGTAPPPPPCCAEERDCCSSTPAKSCCDAGRVSCSESNSRNGCCGAENGGGGCPTENAPATKPCCAASSQQESPCCATENTPCIPTHTCLAVLRPDQSAVDVFDAKGRSRTFHVKNARRDLSDCKLCFSTHGAGEDIDGMLTPCFDGNGEHDDPDEGCPCGEDEAHFHAHIYNPEVCGVDGSGGCLKGGGATARKKATDWRFLSQLTLAPDDDTGEERYSMPISESLPKECNSLQLKGHLDDKGLKLSHWLRWRNEGRKDNACPSEGYCGDACESHRKYPVQHEDHTDYLIYNETNTELHLEHPCNDCGETDIHGRFRLAHTRSWMAEGVRGQRARINLHFFEVHDEPFRVLDMLSGLFELESSRVHAARPAVEEVTSRIGRSQFVSNDICCASEIPQVEAILGPLKGVVEVSVNPTTKTVYVDHEVDLISATGIANALNKEGFGATIKMDAAIAIDQLAGIPTDVFVDSTFDLTVVLKETSERDKEKIAGVMRACLDQKFSEKQIKSVSLNEAERVLAVKHNPYYLTASGIVDALASHLFEVQMLSDGSADGMWALSLMKVDTHDTIEQQSSTVRWTVVLSGVFWIISMFSYIGGNWEYLKYVALVSVAVGLPPIAIKALRTLRRLHFDVNCMMAFAVIGALPLQDYTEAAAVTFLFGISEYLESRATARARNALSAIVCLRPERANVINPLTKDIVVLPASSVAVGSVVSVRAGDKIPCDGIVQEGKSSVDESSLTGENRPVSKSPGMAVSGGTINAGNTQLVVKTTATSNDSAVSRLIRLVEEAQSNRSDTEKYVDSFAKIYTPIVVLAALCMVTIPWAWGSDVGKFWAKNGLITIVIACPCALIISTPVVYVAGLAACAQKGVVIKGGQHLESVGRVKSVAFDKTGTLSEGVFALLNLEVVGSTRSRKEVLQYLALMESVASHPLANAIAKGARNEQIEVPKWPMKNHTLLPGEGISANVGGKAVWVGNRKLFERLNLYDDLSTETAAMTEKWEHSGGTVGFIGIEGEGVVGAYCVADKVREEAQDVVHKLQNLGIDITMLTGDQRPAALGIGSQVGLSEEEIKSGLLPEDKLTEISAMVKENGLEKKWWRAKRTAMMIGDGVNDAPALALADVSVAMGEGAALAMETADCALLDSNLEKLLYLVKMGRRVLRTIIENVVFSIAVKAIVLGFTLAGRSSLWAAIGSDVGAMLLVTLNGMKLLPSSRKMKRNDLAQSSSREV